MEPARGESCPSGQRRGRAAPGGDKVPSLHEKSIYIPTTPKSRGRKRRSPGSIQPRKVWKPQPKWLVANWLRLTEPVRGESCPSGQRRVPATPGDDKVSSRDRKAFEISTTPTTRGRNRSSPWSIPPRSVWKPQPHWVVADWMRLMQPAPFESCPSVQRGGPAAPRGGKFPSQDQKSFSIPVSSHGRGYTFWLKRS